VSKVSFISNFKDFNYTDDEYSLYSAFLYCLSRKETCSMLDTSFNQNHLKRRAILNKLRKDLEVEILSHHLKLFDKLFKKLNDLDNVGRKKCLSFLKGLYDYLPSPYKKRLVELLISSKYIDNRRKGFSLLAKNWDDKYKKSVIISWNKYKDLECAKVIIYNFSEDFLLKNLDALADATKQTYLFDKLHLRIAKKAPLKIKNLKNKYPVSFIYIYAKLGKKMDEIFALEIFNKEKSEHKNRGLLIWCFGQLRLWNVLSKIKEDLLKDK